MTEQLEKNRKLLELKGVPVEEELPEPTVDSDLILQQYQQKTQMKLVGQMELEEMEKKLLALIVKKLGSS